MKFYFFNSTHWDREWYLPFQGFRVKLLEVAEHILYLLEEVDGYDGFTFDGQTIVLEDITEIRPDWKTRLQRQISEERLRVGPWYVMPDEFLVSGEALIRNLLIGHELSHEYGHEAWKVGYVCDVFGHIAQLPQILAGFNVHTAVAARGIPNELPQLLHWQSQDSTICKLIKLAFSGYGNFNFVFGGDERHWKKTDFLEKFDEYFKRHIKSDPEVVIIPDANDHNLPSRQMPDFLKWLREAYPDYEIVLSDFLNIKEFSDDRDIPKISGELTATASVRGANTMKLVANSLSSRYDIKYANDRCQSRLELETEPFLALTAMSGKDITTDRMLLKTAWKTLLKNQAHDFICGCSVDETHFCGMPRYNEVMQITEGIFDKHFPKLKEKDADGNYILKIFNPLPYEYDHAFSLCLTLPTDYPVRFTEPRAPEGYNSFRLFSPDGNEVPYVLRRAEKNMHCILYDVKDFYTINLKYPLAPCSWTSLQLKPSESPVRDFNSMRKGRSGAENRHLKLEITADGSFSVEDKKSGKSYEQFNEFLLDGDVGDGWYYVPPLQNQELVGATESATIKLITDSSILIEFEIIRRYRFPKSIDFHSTCNALYSETVHSNDDAVLEIKTILSLERDARFIKARTLINNTLHDYRLRLVVPTGINGAYFASQAFTMLERKPGRLTGNETLNEIETEAVEKNFGGIIGKSNGQHGVAFISAAGLHEAACHEFDDTNIYVTLLRAFQRTINMNGEEDGELQKKLEFNYSYHFFDGPAPPATLYQQQQMLQANIRHCIYPGKEQSKNCCSPIKVTGNIVSSALKPSQDGNGVILRLFNPSSDSQNGKIELLNPARKIFNSNLQEENLSIYGENLLCINVEIEAHKILTFKLLLGESL